MCKLSNMYVYVVFLPENQAMPNSEDICVGHRGHCSF